jgi:perosamine synthetase
MIPHHRAYFDWSDLLGMLRPGPAVSTFERRIADLVGARFGVLFSDGRVAFRATLQALGIVDSEVVLPACICPSMANAITASGNKIVFADINPDDFCMTPDSLGEVLSSKTRVVVPTHMLGYRADVHAIRSRIGDPNILLVEDYAQYLLPKEKMERPLSGDFGIMSFGRGKPINTVSGGALVTNSEEIYEKVGAFRQKHVHSPSLGISGKKLFWMAGSYVIKNRWIYSAWQRFAMLELKVGHAMSSHSSDMRSVGFPPTPAEFQARLGLHQLSKLKKMSEMRTQWALKLGESLQGIPELRPALMRDGASFIRYPLLVRNRSEIRFCAKMKANGVLTGDTWRYCIPFQDSFRKFLDGRSYPGTEKVYHEAVELPAFPGLTERDRRQIVRAVKQSIGCKDGLRVLP